MKALVASLLVLTVWTLPQQVSACDLAGHWPLERMAWTAGGHIVAWDGSGIAVFDPNGSGFTAAHHPLYVTDWDVDPTGTWAVVAQWEGEATGSDCSHAGEGTYTLDLTTGEAWRVADNAGRAQATLVGAVLVAGQCPVRLLPWREQEVQTILLPDNSRTGAIEVLLSPHATWVAVLDGPEFHVRHRLNTTIVWTDEWESAPASGITVEMLAFSGDDRWLAYVAPEGDGLRLQVVPLVEGGSISIPPPWLLPATGGMEQALRRAQPAWHGASLAVAMQHGIIVFDVTTGDNRTYGLPPDQSIRAMAWSPDGRLAVATGNLDAATPDHNLWILQNGALNRSAWRFPGTGSTPDPMLVNPRERLADCMADKQVPAPSLAILVVLLGMALVRRRCTRP